MGAVFDIGHGFLSNRGVTATFPRKKLNKKPILIRAQRASHFHKGLDSFDRDALTNQGEKFFFQGFVSYVGANVAEGMGLVKG